jgi:gas vesicle protein
MTTRETMATFLMVAAGSTIGFLAGLLAAPRSGRETREQLARRLEDETDELVRRGRDVARQAGEKLEEGLEEGKRAVSDAIGV